LGVQSEGGGPAAGGAPTQRFCSQLLGWEWEKGWRMPRFRHSSAIMTCFKARFKV